LLAGLALAALIDARRAHYFRSAAPWITVLVGLAALMPHLLWLYRNDFEPFGYAMYVHGEKPFAATAIGVLGYLAGSLGYVAVPLIIVFAFARPSRATIADLAWPAEAERRLAAAAFWGPLLLPAAAALASGTEITSLWSMSAWTLLPVMLLSSPAITTHAIDSRRLLAAAVVLPLIMLLAAPAIAIAVHRKGASLPGAQGAQLAAQVERAWHAVTPQPLRYVGGAADIAFAVIAYASDRPRALGDFAQPSRAELSQRGIALVCFADDAGCRREAETKAAGIGPSVSAEVTVVRAFLGEPGRPQRYMILIVPPREPAGAAQAK
jgi:hypothetical protein